MQQAESLRLEGHLGLIFLACEVLEEGCAELADDGALGEIRFQVDGACEQAAFADAGFEDVSQLAVGDPVIDELDDGFDLVEAGQDERSGTVLDFPPLPVRVEIGRELCQSRMFRIAEDAEGVWGLPFGPCGVPKDWRESGDERAGGVVGDVRGGRIPEDGGSVFESGEGFVE